MPDAPGAATFHSPPEVYDRLIGRYGPGLARALCDLAGVAAGQRALDVGCGPGALTAELAARLGPEAVAAVEPSPPFADACRRRVPGARVETAAAEALPFADASFDAALAQLVVNFMADATAGVGEMRRVTCPGGTVAAAVWDYGGEMTFLRRSWDAAVALDPAAEPRDERHMPFCTPDRLAGLWEDTGLENVAVTALEASADYADFADLWAPLETGLAPSGAYVASLAPDARAALRTELERRLDTPRAPFTLTARAWAVTGTVS